MSDGGVPLSVIVITRNEEKNIAECLGSVRWAREIVVVDSQSTDRTVECARQFTEKIHVTAWLGYAAAKKFALAHCTQDWVFWLDADERVPAELAEEIREIVRSSPPVAEGYEVARRAFFLGRWIRHCGWYPGYVARLFRRGHVEFSASSVHEEAIIRGRVGRLQHDLLHFTDTTLYHYFSKFNRYTSLGADEMSSDGRSFALWDLLVRPPFLFFKMYVLRRGFMDGMHGLILSLVSAAYVFCKYAKLRERAVAPPASTAG